MFYPRKSCNKPDFGRNNFHFDLLSIHFLFLSTLRSYVHIMKAFIMFINNIDNEGLDELSTLKDAMSKPDWLK